MYIFDPDFKDFKCIENLAPLIKHVNQAINQNDNEFSIRTHPYFSTNELDCSIILRSGGGRGEELSSIIDYCSVNLVCIVWIQNLCWEIQIFEISSKNPRHLLTESWHDNHNLFLTRHSSHENDETEYFFVHDNDVIKGNIT